jgi:hypothetical protein
VAGPALLCGTATHAQPRPKMIIDSRRHAIVDVARHDDIETEKLDAW